MLFKETLAVILLWGFFSAETKESRGHVSVILLGATGDLAKKYLWQSLFQLYVDEARKGRTFTFYGAAQKDPEVGRKLMFEPLKHLDCSPEVPPNRCAVLKDQFLKLTEYHQLRGEDDYARLNQGIKTSLAQEELVETGRIFYLSVPPFAYAEIARHVNSSCRPPSDAWLRVVLEKPFGHDLLSAQRLAEELAAVFREEEIYRVDHYLGKQVGRNKISIFFEPLYNPLQGGGAEAESGQLNGASRMLNGRMLFSTPERSVVRQIYSQCAQREKYLSLLRMELTAF